MEWRGLIAAILAGGLSFTLIIAVAGGVWEGRPLGEKGGEVMVAICVAIVSALTAYFTTRNGQYDNKRTDRRTDRKTKNGNGSPSDEP